MIYRILGLLILFAALAVVALTFKNDTDFSKLMTSSFFQAPAKSCHERTPAQQLTDLIRSDFDQLLRSNQLPAEWGQIGSMSLHMNSTLAKAILGKHTLPFKRIQEGTHFLEVEILDLPDEENPGIIIQASLFEIKSQNKIFEVGRTYTMSQLNKTDNGTDKLQQ